MSLIDSVPTGTVKVASQDSIAFLIDLVPTLTVEQFEGFPQQRISDLIERALELPPTQAQVERVQSLFAQLGLTGSIATKSNGQARRQIKNMEADLAARTAALKARTLTPERAAAADDLLATLIGGVVEAAVETTPAKDEIPF